MGKKKTEKRMRPRFCQWLPNSKKVALTGQYPFLGLEASSFIRDVHVAPLVPPRLFSHFLSSAKLRVQLAFVCSAW